MERVRSDDGSMPTACFMCPARVYQGGDDCCNPALLDDPNRILKVARYRPDTCPKGVKGEGDGIPPEILLRKILGR